MGTLFTQHPFMIEEIWREVLALGSQDLDLNRSFNELGGTPVTARKLAARVSKVFGISIEDVRFLENSTLGRLKKILETRQKDIPETVSSQEKDDGIRNEQVESSGPFFFGPEHRRLFGWLHETPSQVISRNVGVVFCNPFGFESLSMHRSMRHFAEAFAREGFPSLRFDYDGTGDSAGSDLDPERVKAWLDSIHQAIDTLKERSGVESVHLFGIRLGATLAATAAAGRKDCSGLMTIAPVISPSFYMRELASFQAWGRFAKSPDGNSGIGEGDREACGFVITAETSAALSLLDLSKQPSAAPPKVLVFERDHRSSSESWTNGLKNLGVSVDVRRVDGYAAMSVDPHETVVPTLMIANAVEWLSAQAPVQAGSSSVSSPVSGRTSAPNCTESEGIAGVIETPVFIDSERTLFGIVARAKDVAPNGRAYIVLNAGAQHRIGPSRLWVKFSREWAKTGATVLRLDVSGIGDSRTRMGERENDVYAKSGPCDIADAIDYLKRNWGAKNFEVIGFCGSAYQALKAVVQGVPVDSVLAINPQVYFWDPHRPVNELPAAVSSETNRYKGAVQNPESWKKLFRGEVQVLAAISVFRRRFFDIVSNRSRSIARQLRLPLKDDLAAELRAIAKRRVRFRFMFSEGEGGDALLYELAGKTAKNLEGKGAFSVERIKSVNHTFTAVWSHRVFKSRLDAWLGISKEL